LEYIKEIKHGVRESIISDYEGINEPIAKVAASKKIWRNFVKFKGTEPQIGTFAIGSNVITIIKRRRLL